MGNHNKNTPNYDVKNYDLGTCDFFFIFVELCCVFQLHVSVCFEKDMAVCYQRSAAPLSNLSTSELSSLRIDAPSIPAATPLPVTTAMMTPPSSQKNSCTKSLSIPEEDSGYGPD